MTYDAIVLFSGGKDSTIALWWALERYKAVMALSIDYHGRPTREREIARQICSDYTVTLAEVNLSFLRPLGLIQGSDVSTRRQGYIPMRNLVFYAVAGYFADVHHSEAIVGGHVSSDGDAHSDASPEFYQALSNIYSIALDRSFSRSAECGANPSLVVQQPLQKLSDSEALRFGYQLGAPIDRSWSCWRDGSEPCGECVSCRDRERALSALK